MDDLTKHLADALEHCHERGMPLPYLLVAAAINGSIIGVRYVESGQGLAAEPLVSTDSNFELPINIMIVDAAGEAMRVRIDQEGTVFH